jgi:methionine--tRNA ligase beta chain
MIRGKLTQIFGESISKMNKIINHLDKRLGVVSDLGHTNNLSTKAATVMMCNKINLESSKHNQTENTTQQTQINVEEKPKKENKKAPKKTPDENDIFQECDLRVGRVKEITSPENLNDIYFLKVDMGEGNLREIGTGLKKNLGPEEFINKLVIIFANLRPKKLGTFYSNGMILAAFDEKEQNFELVRPDESKFKFNKFITDSKPGDKVYLEGKNLINDPLPLLNDKKFKKSIEKFNSDNECLATFNGIKLMTTSGFLKVKSLNNCMIR